MSARHPLSEERNEVSSNQLQISLARMFLGWSSAWCLSIYWATPRIILTTHFALHSKLSEARNEFWVEWCRLLTAWPLPDFWLGEGGWVSGAVVVPSGWEGWRGWRWLEVVGVVGGRRNQSSGGGSAVNFYVRATSASSAVSQPTSVDPTLPPRSWLGDRVTVVIQSCCSRQIASCTWNREPGKRVACEIEALWLIG